MKKILSTILAIVMILNMGVCMAFASGTSATAEVSSASALPGEKVEIFISIECANGIKTLSFLDFAFDSTVLTIVESECAWLADGKLKDIDFENNASIITFEDNTPYSGEILKLVFTVSEDAEIGSTPISCKMVATRMIDKVETEITTSISDGEVIVVDSTSTLDDFEYEINADGIVIIGYVGNKTTVVIEECYEVDGVSYDVVEIEESAFEGNEDIKSVTIPETVTKIGDYAFYDCTSLTEVTILGKQTEIGSTALGYYYISRRENGVVEGFAIYGYANSTAESYAATDDEITFIVMEEDCVHSGGSANCVDVAVCEKCGDTYGTTNTNNHKTLVVDEAVAPSCIATGLTKGSHCEACGEEVVEQEILPPSGHDYNSIVTIPTCTEAGYTTYTCSACGDSYVADEVAATGHTYDAVVTAPTCTADGYTTYTCACGDTYVADEVAATGHDYVAAETTAPTCTEAGVMTYTCACGDAYTEEIAAKGHALTAVEAKAPTCTEAGYEAYEFCSACDYTTYAEVAATGHTYEAVVTAPTCTAEGYTTYTCACGDTYTEEIAAKGHTLTAVEAKAPTCTEAGYEAYEFCSACVYTTYAEVAATGHTYEAVVTAPTCTEAGYTTYTCACGDSYVADEVAAIEHSFVNDVCEYCGKSIYEYTFSVQEPSRTEIRNKDGIVLHANIEGTYLDDTVIEWDWDNDKFDVEENDDGTITIIAKNKGWTTFTATLYDADGNELATDSVDMYSKSGFFDKIGGFFRSLFGSTKIYEK